MTCLNSVLFNFLNMPPNYGWATNFGITAEMAKAVNRESGF